MESTQNEFADDDLFSPAYMEGALRLLDNLPASAVPPEFRLTEDGLFALIETKQGAMEVPVSSPIVVRARARDVDSMNWSLLMELVDPDGRIHSVTVPQSMLYGSSAALHELLSNHGAVIDPRSGAMAALTQYLSRAKVPSRVTQVSQVGWHDDVYVLPDQTYGNTHGERFVYRGPTRHANFAVSGSLEAWNETIGRFCIGNDNLVLAVCLSLSSVLLKLTGAEPGGIHWHGDSSVGKTTMLRVAASVWGGGPAGRVLSWRLTDNAAESLCAANSDGFIALDEINQVDPRALYQMLYMFTAGQGKQRASRDGGVRNTPTWRLMVGSNGERPIVDMIRSGGQKPQAGQMARIVDVAAAIDGGFGSFNTLHGFEGGSAFSNHLQAACRENYGMVARKFIDCVSDSVFEMTEAAIKRRDEFVQRHCPKGADGQVVRVAQRFGLCAAAGDLAVEFGVLDWPQEEPARAVGAVFQRYLAERGTAGPAEMLLAVRQVLERVSTLSTKHFDELQHAPGGDMLVERSLERFGFRSRTKSGPEFWITPEGWSRLCDGYNPREVAREMVRLGYLEQDKEGKTSVAKAITGQPKKARYYHLSLHDDGDFTPEPEAPDTW